MDGLPPLPKLPRAKSGKQRRRMQRSANDLDRVVMWRDKGDHTYGICAKCGEVREALDLRWTPDRIVFGEFHQGFWACIDNCGE